MANMKELNLTEQEGLQDILDKHESSWSEAEVAHLTARADYLSSDDKARLDEASNRVAVQVEEAAKAEAKAAKEAAKAEKPVKE